MLQPAGLARGGLEQRRPTPAAASPAEERSLTRRLWPPLAAASSPTRLALHTRIMLGLSSNFPRFTKPFEGILRVLWGSWEVLGGPGKA